MSIWFLVALLLIVASITSFYVGRKWNEKETVRIARLLVQGEMDTLREDHGWAMGELSKLQTDVLKANARIKQLEAIASIPLQKMPTGTLRNHHNQMLLKKQHVTDPTATDILTGDLPPMQLL
jgi:hypothetical protein